jgi:hypothetical protein
MIEVQALIMLSPGAGLLESLMMERSPSKPLNKLKAFML